MNRHEAMLQLRKMTMWALDLVFPPHCAACRLTGHILCPTCQAQLQPVTLPRCPHCHDHFDADGQCHSCRYHPLRINGLRAFGRYEGVLRTCIHALKYEGCTRLAQPLGHLLTCTVQTYNIHADMLVPVPLHSEREQQRGYNHAALLADVCSRETGIPLRKNIVMRQRATAAQVGLGPQERLRNVSGAFRCSPALSGKQLTGYHILLIDDVCTTGATIEACAAPLLAAGARSICGLVLARPTP